METAKDDKWRGKVDSRTYSIFHLVLGAYSWLYSISNSRELILLVVSSSVSLIEFALFVVTCCRWMIVSRDILTCRISGYIQAQNTKHIHEEKYYKAHA